jgi:hypothetical protein
LPPKVPQSFLGQSQAERKTKAVFASSLVPLSQRSLVWRFFSGGDVIARFKPWTNYSAKSVF